MRQMINIIDAEALIKDGKAVLIDVREPEEFMAEHISYAMSVPLSSLEDGFQMLNIPKNITIILQCLKGSRSQMACDRIQGLNSCKNKILSLDGGIEAWKKNGFPVIGVPSPSSELSIFRQVQIIVGFLVAICVLFGFLGITEAFIFAGALGSALFLAGITGWCGLAMILSKMPWNK
ncbi:MAG: sulfurtransferase [Alphaproteobacteria bacterium]|nr:MAG: sulfurtransferase [Alphaproteobacteria bacterium]